LFFFKFIFRFLMYIFIKILVRCTVKFAHLHLTFKSTTVNKIIVTVIRIYSEIKFISFLMIACVLRYWTINIDNWRRPKEKQFVSLSYCIRIKIKYAFFLPKFVRIHTETILSIPDKFKRAFAAIFGKLLETSR